MRSSLSPALYPDRLPAFSLGFSAGVAVGFLLAPDEGRRARHRLADGAREAALSAQKRARVIAEPIAGRVRETSQELAERHVPPADDWDVVDGKEILNNLPGLARR